MPRCAQQLLAQLDVIDRNGAGLVEHRTGVPARLTLLTARGQSALERGATGLRDELKKIGVTIDVVPLEGNFLVKKFVAFRPGRELGNNAA